MQDPYLASLFSNSFLIREERNCYEPASILDQLIKDLAVVLVYDLFSHSVCSFFVLNDYLCIVLTLRFLLLFYFNFSPLTLCEKMFISHHAIFASIL